MDWQEIIEIPLIVFISCVVMFAAVVLCLELIGWIYGENFLSYQLNYILN